MRGVSCPDPLRFNASCCPEKNGQHPILEEGEMALMALKNITWSERATFLLLITGVQLKGVLYNPTAHNILLHTGRWGYVHRPETKVVRGEFATSEAKPRLPEPQLTPPIPRILWRRGMGKKQSWRNSAGCAQGRLPGTAAMRDLKR